jgi:hypothetical protein
MPATKICNKCKKEKPVSEFVKSKRIKSGTTCCCKVCQREISFFKYHTDPVFRRQRLDGNLRYIKKNRRAITQQQRERYHTDPLFRERQKEVGRLRWRRLHPTAIPRIPKPDIVCQIIQEHHETLKDDPEHLPTEFIQKLIGVRCK